MQYTVTFLGCQCKRVFETDDFECRFKFSVGDSSLIGAPREKESIHSLKVVMTLQLMVGWVGTGALDMSAIDDMVKVAFQSAEEYIAGVLKAGPLRTKDLPPLIITLEDSPDSCPYNLPNIDYPSKTTFTVDIREQDNDSNSVNVHPNIRKLLTRMDTALSGCDFPGVLHTSASVFETMAKDIVGIPAVQDQTLKSFFARYRKDSILDDKVLDCILGICDLRNTTPLAGHGSTQTPSISREQAIALCEMTKAFVNIEYKSREK